MRSRGELSSVISPRQIALANKEVQAELTAAEKSGMGGLLAACHFRRSLTKQYTNINGYCHFAVKKFSSLEAIDENFLP